MFPPAMVLMMPSGRTRRMRPLCEYSSAMYSVPSFAIEMLMGVDNWAWAAGPPSPQYVGLFWLEQVDPPPPATVRMMPSTPTRRTR